MKSILKLITVAFLTLAPLTVFAQSNVAHINVQQLISEMPEVVAAQNELAKLEKDYTTQIDNAFKEFQTKAQSYSADAANQTDVTNQARQKNLKVCRLIYKSLETQLLKNYKKNKWIL